MYLKRIISMILVLSGIAMLGGSYYIRDQIAKGKLQIASGQEKIDKVDSFFSLPGTKMIGDEMTKSGRQKIAEGNDQITYYTRKADRLHLWGIIVMILGVLAFFVPIPRRM